MTLQQILFGTFTPPQVKSTIHRIGFASEKRYEPPKEKVVVKPKKPNKNTIMGSRKQIYNIIKRRKVPVCAADIMDEAGYTRNHCSIICTALFRLGLVNRNLVREGNTKTYFYTVKES